MGASHLTAYPSGLEQYVSESLVNWTMGAGMIKAGKSRLRNEIGLVMLILLTMSCGLSTGVKVCGPEIRAAGMLGQVMLADGTSTANAGLGVSEVRDPGRPETEVATYNIYAQSDFLRTHMTRAELRDTQTPSRLLGSYTPPTVLPLPPNLFAFGGPYDWPVPVEDGRTLLLSGQLVLEIQTDLPSQPLVRIPLTVLRQNDPTWTRMTGEGCG